QPLVQLDAVRGSHANQNLQLARGCALANGLRVEERRHHRLLDLSVLDTEQTFLRLARMGELGLQDGRPVLPATFVLLKLRNARQLTCGYAQAVRVRVDQEDLRA